MVYCGREKNTHASQKVLMKAQILFHIMIHLCLFSLFAYLKCVIPPHPEQGQGAQHLPSLGNEAKVILKSKGECVWF